MKTFFTCLVLALAIPLSAQPVLPDSIVNMQPVLVKKVPVNEDDFSKVYLYSAFAEKKLRDTSQLFLLRSTEIVSVDLVYTKYRQSETFVQKKLNLDRLHYLYEILPEAFNENVQWRLIEQTQAADTAEAEKYFHGFIISFRPKLELVVGTSEMDYIDLVMEKLEAEVPPTCMHEVNKLIMQKKLPSAPVFGSNKLELKKYLLANMSFPKLKWREKMNGAIEANIYVSEEGVVDSFTTTSRKLKPIYTDIVRDVMSELPDFNPSLIQTGNVSYIYKAKVSFYARNRKHKKINATISQPKIIPKCTDTAGAFMITDYSNLYIPDTTVLSVLHRNKNWENMLVVCDFTGSMSPYTAQLLVWYHLMLESNDDRIKYFCFFNDGNNKADFRKNIGTTGGVYITEAGSMEEVRALAKETMKNGSGGDVQENNVEALITAIKAYPDAQDIIMIADNFATPRDLSLLNKINKPVKIILCGTQYGINVEYLNFARKTNGSIHTIDQDLENLASMHEGERITIDGIIYEISNGSFRKVTNI